MSAFSSDRIATIRRYWLKALFANYIMGCIYLFIIFPSPRDLSPDVRTLSMSIVVIAMTASSYIFYRCAYQKPGTLLLTISLFAKVFALLFVFMSEPSLRNSVNIIPFGIIFSAHNIQEALLLVAASTTSWTLYILHYLLRRANKQILLTQETEDTQ